jgi:hypothetical protein
LEGAVNLDNVSRDEMIVGGLAILLAICLLALPWFSVGGGSVGGISIPSFDFTATDAPDGWLAVIAVLVLLAFVADLVIEKFSPQTQLPEIGGSRTNTRFILAAVAVGFMALKFLFHIHFSDFGWGFYASVIVAAAFLYFAMQARMAAPVGGTSMSSMPASPPPPPPPVAATPSAAPSSAPSEPGPSGGSTPPPAS